MSSRFRRVRANGEYRSGAGGGRGGAATAKNFYMEGETLVAVSVATTANFSVGQAKRLFEDSGLRLGRGFDVSADGQRFVVVETVKEPDPPTIRVVQNWYEQFRAQQADK